MKGRNNNPQRSNKNKAINVLHRKESSSDSEDVLRLHALKKISTFNTSRIEKEEDKRWEVTLKLNTRDVRFRIDTGARCNTMVLDELHKIGLQENLESSKTVLRSYTNHQIKPVGAVNVETTYGNLTVPVQFEVIDISQENIICGATAEILNLVRRINTVEEQSDHIPEEFYDIPDLTTATGALPGEYTIKLDPTAKGVVHAPRRQPAALKSKIIDTLKQMEQNKHIVKVDEPTEWVSSMVVSLRNDKVRICLDPLDLNKAILREHYPMKTIEEVVSDTNMADAKVFSVLDAKQGFLQILLDDESSLLTTFNTPIGRYRWLRLPFGLKCAPEIYQRIMDQMLKGIDGATAIMDDILVAGRSVEHHDGILKWVLERTASYNLKLNYQKCKIRLNSVKYVGHIITSQGVQADPDKLKAVKNMPVPMDKSAVKRFLGFVTYLSKFIPNFSKVSAPLREIQHQEDFAWGPSEQSSFDKLKELCCNSPVLAYYDVQKPVEVQCDASKDGLGCVLLQEGRPIAYSSRSMSKTETRYA